MLNSVISVEKLEKIGRQTAANNYQNRIFKDDLVFFKRCIRAVPHNYDVKVNLNTIRVML